MYAVCISITGGWFCSVSWPWLSPKPGYGKHGNPHWLSGRPMEVSQIAQKFFWGVRLKAPAAQEVLAIDNAVEHARCHKASIVALLAHIVEFSAMKCG